MKKLRKEVLTHAVAMNRSKAIQYGIDYDILFNLSMSGDCYEVACRISFNLQDVASV